MQKTIIFYFWKHFRNYSTYVLYMILLQMMACMSMTKESWPGISKFPFKLTLFGCSVKATFSSYPRLSLFIYVCKPGFAKTAINSQLPTSSNIFPSSKMYALRTCSNSHPALSTLKTNIVRLYEPYYNDPNVRGKNRRKTI